MTSKKKQIKLGVFLAGTGHHVASWRHPDAPADASMNLDYFKELARTAERGKLDMLFLADSLSIDSKSHPNVLTRFEPFTLLSALAQVTSRIGLTATASTTYSEPFHIARQFASLDHLSNGRAGWNVVTSSIESTALNFSGEKHLEHHLRYQRAEEFVEAVKGLWDSWEEDAFIRNKETGEFFDKEKMHELNHKGDYFSVRGPLNVSRTPQGQPVIIQAGSSGDGKALAAKTAEVIFTAQNHLESAQEFYQSIKKQAAEFGRDPEKIAIMPGIFPVIADTEEEARAKYQELQDLIIPSVGLQILQNYLGGIDLSAYPLDGPLPKLDADASNAVKSRFKLVQEMAERDNMTIRELYKYVAGSRGHHIFVGTPEQLADKMQEWVDHKACDGFNIMPPLLPEGIELFVDKVVPILQERGVFRNEYEGTTLREHFGLEKPVNRYAK
ncbi:nitrilotriacetate monooxygenase [Bacillus halotolerans]|uniref:LLM class flavin-dependent oxidoreductase n=1 Tax=Bacillus halotolerans TaxID=260554 RepID=A0A9Q4EGF3_9BACI|nr:MULTISPECIES: LLM class flavin-dependent oxidoreductase [Bacillus]MBV7318675.1 LLM class flavin-dependent oxidoreductase [Halalkalibacterium halodurans]AZV49505.1 LLM class flavin-dependent oxidoreductase [Bacillus halotolerans]MBJ7570454.1 LLM class flavin-dependent oxidoreductase [Bacillus halotolerans]MBU5247010.1 LLM class flavin-dependent oxidoreductase [Bacillus halotolerans]MCM3355545.1 LLM class flavin-dependent oxidoreductase [Bacillus halotolerans]